jgi:hypothetical protein
MDNDRLPKRAITYRPKGREARGVRWKDGLISEAGTGINAYTLKDNVLKMSHYTPRRRLGERRYSSYTFSTTALDGSEWSASLPGHALAPGKEPPVPIVQEAGWAPEPVWTEDDVCYRPLYSLEQLLLFLAVIDLVWLLPSTLIFELNWTEL